MQNLTKAEDKTILTCSKHGDEGRRDECVCVGFVLITQQRWETKKKGCTNSNEGIKNMFPR